MYLGSPRMAEAVIGEKVTLEEMGGARMHCQVSGVGDFLVATEKEAIELAKRYFSYLPQNYRQGPVAAKAEEPERQASELKALIPESHARAYDMKQVIKTIVDRGSFLEIKELLQKSSSPVSGESAGRSSASSPISRW